MTKDLISYLLYELMNTALWVAGPVLITALSVGVLISILQVATQIQEMTLTFVPKMLAVAFVIMTLSGWMLSKLTEFSVFVFGLAEKM